MTITFTPYKKADKQKVVKCMVQFYQDDPGGKIMTRQKAKKTLRKLSRNPHLGKVQVFRRNDKIVGYCLLIYYWSNEYGGFLCFIDELYVREKYRNQGLGSRFLEQLKRENLGVVALCLEVLPQNKRVLELYKRLGFKEDGRSHLICEL